MDTVPARTRVVIIDDHAVVRAGLRYVFETLSSVQVCAEVATAAEALEAVRTHRPDLVILDLALGNASGRALIPPLRQCQPPPRVLVMSMHDECVWGRRCSRPAPTGSSRKARLCQCFLAAVPAVLGGSRWIEGRAVAAASGTPPTPTAADLSARELQILEGIASSEREGHRRAPRCDAGDDRFAQAQHPHQARHRFDGGTDRLGAITASGGWAAALIR